jgi:hypothetical protein
MTTKFESRKTQNQRTSTYYFPGRWVTLIAQAVAIGITNVVSIAITVMVIFLLLFGSLWLAYTYLPTSIFYIILAVLIADIALGIVMRSVLSRR